MYSPCYTWCRIAVDWFGHDVVEWYFWELFTYNVKVVATGIDVYVLFRENLREPVEGLLKLCATHSEEINKLLRIIVPTAWP